MKTSCLSPFHFMITLSLAALSPQARAESCQATQTSVTTAKAALESPAPVQPAESAPVALAASADVNAATINTQDINLEKSFMQDGDLEHAQYSTRDGDPLGKDVFISATVDPSNGDVTLIIRDLRTGLSANAAGAFGNDGIIATSLSGIVNGIQKLITVTCQK